MTTLFTLNNATLFLEFSSSEPARLSSLVLESDSLAGKQFRNIGVLAGNQQVSIEAVLTSDELLQLEAVVMAGQNLGICLHSASYQVLISSLEHKRNGVAKRRAKIELKVVGQL